ncbi:cytochrome b/b6 domain-containing protein [Ahrensia marina]|uniref:cytochrome b n=1 Tax=Ahrensia marina TaxID=1514904 RepID=UPI0035D0477B
MTRYHPVLVTLHWLLALLIIAALLIGNFALDPIPESDPAKIDALRSHMIGGAVILLLMLVRLVVRLRTEHPPEADIGISALNRIARLAHWALYLLVFALVGSGIAMSVLGGLPPIVFGGSGDPLPVFDELAPRAAHGFFAAALAILILGHIAAAFYHELVRHDGLISRMWFGKRS